MGCCHSTSKKSVFKAQHISPDSSDRQVKLLIPIDSRFTPREGPMTQRGKLKAKKPVVDSRKTQETDVEVLDSKIVPKHKTVNDIRFIQSALKNNSLFKELSNSYLSTLIEDMLYLQVNQGDTLIVQDTPGDKFFILVEGKLQIIINDEPKNFITPGNSFGEVALLHNTPRTATIVAVTRSGIWSLNRAAFKRAMETISKAKESEMQSFIDSVPFLSILTAEQKKQLLSTVVPLSFNENDKIVVENDPGDLFYIIEEGVVTASVGGEIKRTMTRGEFFGEQALLYNTNRTATVTANSKVSCLTIARNQLIQALGNRLEDIIYKNSLKIALDQIPVFAKLTAYQLDLIISKCQVVKYPSGTIVIPSSTNLAKKIWIVVKGKLANTAENKEFAVFSMIGNAIDEETMIEAEHDIAAVEDSDIAEITRNEMERLLSGPINTIFIQNEMLSVFKKIPLLNVLPDKKLNQLISLLKVKTYVNEENIVTENTEGHEFFIIKSGKVQIFKDGAYLRTINKHDYFGERALMLSEIRSATVKADGKVSCWTLHKEDFMNIIHSARRNLLLKRLILQDDSVGIEDLMSVKHLGSGQFGSVHLTIHRNKNTVYALKAVSRKKVEIFKCHNDILLEKKVLLQLDHPFIVKLVKTFKDAERLYFLMEYVQGLDLFDTLRRMDLLRESEARFYTACLVLILEHLHERNIIYRDLKPENVMVDEEGYPKLIDFGTAKISDKTFTTIGTPHYMAPELILSGGYNKAVDLWTLGVMLYEFVSGRLPFGDDLDDPHAIYNSILSAKKINFPKFLSVKSPMCSLIDQLLSRNPAIRNGGGYDALKKHPFLIQIDWVIST
jgi:cGMP-dependent protein kinase